MQRSIDEVSPFFNALTAKVLKDLFLSARGTFHISNYLFYFYLFMCPTTIVISVVTRDRNFARGGMSTVTDRPSDVSPWRLYTVTVPDGLLNIRTGGRTLDRLMTALFWWLARQERNPLKIIRKDKIRRVRKVISEVAMADQWSAMPGSADSSNRAQCSLFVIYQKWFKSVLSFYNLSWYCCG